MMKVARLYNNEEMICHNINRNEKNNKSLLIRQKMCNFASRNAIGAEYNTKQKITRDRNIC